MPEIEISRPDATSELLPEVVRLHRRELSGGFLSSLGDRALHLLFSFAAESPTAVLLVARETGTGRVCGFLLGTYDTSGFYRAFMRQKSLRAALLVGPKLFLSPARIKKVLETLLYPKRKEVSSLPPAELLDLAVDSEMQKAGVGTALFERFAAILRENGTSVFRITTGGSLHQAHRFYERRGARQVGQLEIHQGQITRIYLFQNS